jgi:hypothetical protein
MGREPLKRGHFIGRPSRGDLLRWRLEAAAVLAIGGAVGVLVEWRRWLPTERQREESSMSDVTTSVFCPRSWKERGSPSHEQSMGNLTGIRNKFQTYQRKMRGKAIATFQTGQNCRFLTRRVFFESLTLLHQKRDRGEQNATPNHATMFRKRHKTRSLCK